MVGIDRGPWKDAAASELDTLQSQGIHLARIGMTFDQKPAELADLVNECVANGVSPMLLVEYYGHMGELKHGAPTIYDYWHGLGHDLASLYGHKIVLYTAFNEPDLMLFVDATGPHFDDPRGHIDPQEYYQAIKGFADGIHAVDPTLKVAPEGFSNPNYHSDYTLGGIGPVIAPLFNDGTLDGIDLHTYSSDTDHWKISEQGAFDRVKKACGITRDITLYCTEFNSGKKPGDDARFLTELWNSLGVVGNGGDDSAPKTGYTMPYTLFELESRQSYGLAASIKPWQPSQRARTLKLVIDLTKGASFDLLEPHTTGIYTLKSPNSKIWVWQNRLAYSSIAGTSFTVTGIPPKTTSIKIYRYNSALDAPFRTVPVAGQGQLSIDNLPQDETLMFVADSGDERPARFKQVADEIDTPPATTAANPAANLIDGGGFERGLGDWQNYGTSAAITMTGVHSGRAAVLIQPTGGVIYSVDGLTPNSTYTFSGYIKITKPGDQARLTVQGYGGQTMATGSFATTYKLRSITFTAVKTSAELVFWKDGGTGGAEGDDFALVPGTEPLEIAGSDGAAAPDAPAAAAVPGNLLTDGGFEDGALGPWANSGTAVSLVQDGVHGGTYAAKISPTGGAIQEVTGLKPNTTYVFSGWAKVNEPGESLRFTVAGFGGAETSVGVRSTEFSQKSIEFTTGATNSSAKVIFWKDGGTGSAVVDDFSLVAK